MPAVWLSDIALHADKLLILAASLHAVVIHLSIVVARFARWQHHLNSVFELVEHIRRL